ncbi:uncharacterized protein LOC119311266 isoform X2 [Triticum dicoccoides]|uniref:uncharacterized protein LOC119311266 isoform X2 n=1 Tax=Triticum dicoccoides TaxID=85692 RepID=UPI0018912A1B|nr:uncharacterized protein LOC119311266 isoform X2 [Triticum dicoccoides]
MGEASPESSGAVAGGPSVPGPPRKGKSCKGCLYYSSVLKSRGYNPICVGIPRSIPQVPGFVVEEPREEAAAQGHDLRQFKYACAGYSMFVDDRDAKSGENDAKALLPYCQGLELLVDSRMVERKSPAVEHASTRNPKPKEAAAAAAAATQPQEQGQRPQLARQEFMARFRRSAGLVASGVAKNLNKTGSYIKQNVEDIFSPDRRPPPKQ